MKVYYNLKTGKKAHFTTFLNNHEYITLILIIGGYFLGLFLESLI